MSDTTKTLSGEQYLVTHSVGPNQAGIRLDRFLMERYRRRSREQLKKAIDSGSITIQRHGPRHALGKMKPSFALQAGDIVQVLSIRRPEPAVNFDYKILFEDEDILVISKPPNLPVHPAGRFFFNTLLVHLKTQGFKTDLESERKFFLVHRIDKETSGVLLLAKTKYACNQLTSQFRNRETEKYYLAIVRGVPKENQFDVDAPIGKIPGSRIGLKMYSVPLEKGGLPSLTHFELVESRTATTGLLSGNTYSLLACFPRTGRQHQIRAHAEIAGVPLVGDKIYGMNDDEVLTLLDGHRDDERSEVSPEPMEEELGESDEEEYATDLSFEDQFFEEANKTKETNQEANREEQPFEVTGPTLNYTTALYPELQARLILPRHALHAAGLRFKHPTTGKDMVFESGLPDDLKAFFEAITGAPLSPFTTQHW